MWDSGFLPLLITSSSEHRNINFLFTPCYFSNNMFIPYVDIFLIFETHKRENIETYYFNQIKFDLQSVCVCVYSEMFDSFFFFGISPYCAMWLYKFMSHLHLKKQKNCQLSEPF